MVPRSAEPHGHCTPEHVSDESATERGRHYSYQYDVHCLDTQAAAELGLISEPQSKLALHC